MRWVQVRKGALDAHKVRFTEAAADVHIARDQSNAVRDGGESPDQNEFDLCLNESARQLAKVLHFVFASRRGANRRIATHHHWPASAPTVFLPGCPRATRRLFRRPRCRRTSVPFPAPPKRPLIFQTCARL